MKIKVTDGIKDYEGKVIREGQPGQEKEVTFRDVFSFALNSQQPNEVVAAEDKAKMFQASSKLYSSSEPDFTVDQLALIKQRVGLSHSALVYGRVCELFGEKLS